MQPSTLQLELYDATLAALRAMYPGRIFLPLKDACFAMGIALKTFHNHMYAGHPQFPVRRVGGKIVAALTDLAEATVAIQLGAQYVPKAAEAAAPSLPAPFGLKRQGRPTRAEEDRAKAAGLTVPQLRAREAAK